MPKFSDLPEDIINNHIIPFSYQLQPNHLLKDVRSFHKTFEKVEDTYSFEYNYTIWLNDLVEYIIIKRIDILSRYWILETFFDYNYSERCNKKRIIRLYWGLLKPFERILFLDTYC